jgi:hypothetical protein
MVCQRAKEREYKKKPNQLEDGGDHFFHIDQCYISLEYRLILHTQKGKKQGHFKFAKFLC